jgi:hypothetical protein
VSLFRDGGRDYLTRIRRALVGCVQRQYLERPDRALAIFP